MSQQGNWRRPFCRPRTVKKNHDLRRLISAADWRAYHAIRRDSIFAPLLPGHPYDEADADEFRPGNLPHVLDHSGDIVGVVRIDLIDDVQVGLRLIGIRMGLQRQGHGAALLRLAEQVAAGLGRRQVVINAHPTSLKFYLANGYAAGDWKDSGPVHPDLIRVGKELSRETNCD
jgi:hypothetical protein